MFDRLFAPALTFVMLIGGTAAIGSGLFATPRAELVAAAQAQRAAPVAHVMLEPVVIVGKRADLARDAGLPQPASATPAAEGQGVRLHTPTVRE